ncbi:ribosome biogenesis GTPase Der [Candidatus Peregrinibacteria bacterium]|nr:ribosome biogenesis GTPase Der [Candidatus Peregrinibacteria bacterium]
MEPQPTIAIVGKPNVGKSTLFNRLIGKKHAITSEHAGTTRDRVSQNALINGFTCIMVDTGGLDYGKKENIEADVQSQANLAINDADITLFILDLSQNLTTDDFMAADILRKSKKPIILVANKTDNENIAENVYNIYELGFGEPVKISAIHKTGIDELKDQIEKDLKKLKFKKKSPPAPKNVTNIAILGKPNAGKSSLVNSLLGAEKIIVSDIAGTTRDSIDTEFVHNDRTYNLIDTAGLRRPGKRGKGIEKYSALRCITAVERADIVILLLDGNVGITNQDSHIIKYALESQKGIILAINKIDLLEKGEDIKNLIIRKLRQKFSFIPWAPVLFLSAKDKKNIYQIFQISDEISKERNKRIKTAELNNFFQKITHKHLPASAKIRKPKFMYATQIDINPPKFALFFKNPETLHFSYPRYLENELRKEYGFTGTTIDLKFKKQISKN